MAIETRIPLPGEGGASSRVRWPRTASLSSLLALGLLGSCTDQPTSPGRQDSGRPLFNSAPPSIPLGSYTLPTPSTNAPIGGTVGWHSSGIPITANAWTLVTFRGSISISKNYECDAMFDTVCPSSYAGRVAPPKGIEYGYLSDSARVRYTSGGLGGIALSHDDTTSWAVFNFLYGGTLEVKRHGITGSASCTSQPDPDGPPTNCPRQGMSMAYAEAGYYVLSGAHSVRAEIIVPLYLDPSSFDVAPGTAVTFTAKKHPKVPIGITHWYFRYDDVGATGLLDNPATPISGGTFVSPCYQQSTCTFTPTRSGRMYVLGTWQTKPARASAIVFVNSGRLALDAAPTTVWSGDSVTFTPRTPDGTALTVQRWEWKPDTVPGRTTACANGDATCRRPVFESGTMYVIAAVGSPSTVERGHIHVQARPDSLKMTADPAKIIKGETVTFTVSAKSGRNVVVQAWSWSPAGTAVACETADPVCEAVVNGTGTMGALATVGGTQYSASAAVTADTLDCPTGDALLDDPAVRRGLMKAFGDSYADDPNHANRREQVGAVMEYSGKLAALSLPMTQPSTACRSWWQLPDTAAGGRLRSFFHTHPAAVNDSLACPNFPGGWGNVAAGGSPEDWKTLKRVNTEPKYLHAGWHPIDMYIVDKHIVYKLQWSAYPAGTPWYKKLGGGIKKTSTFTWNGQDPNGNTCNWNQF
jgi:plastocyanin